MSGLPDRLAASIAEALEARTGRTEAIVSATPVSGGCVNEAKVVRTDRGNEFFLKHNPTAPSGLFEAEAKGLTALRETGTIRVPEVAAYGVSPAWLLLEYVSAGPATPAYWEELGSGLAALHAPAIGRPGYEHDNFIGPLEQRNDPSTDWGEFWVSRRVLPQLASAGRVGLLDPEDRVWREAITAVRRVLSSASASEAPSLLHGDLWSGNVYPDTNGRPVLIDPAVYRGDPEVDLAMSELFGGFEPVFYRAYRSSRPVAPEYDRVRRTVYQLYPLLVHANLFGAGYASSAQANAALLAWDETS